MVIVMVECSNGGKNVKFRRLSRDVGPTWTTGSTSALSTRRERTVSWREVTERTLTSTEVFWTLSLPGMDPGDMDRQGSN